MGNFDDAVRQMYGAEATDALFDTSDQALAVRFGVRALEQIRDWVDPRQTARLAFSYAARVLQMREDDAAIDEYVAELQASGLVLGADFGVTH
jgi:hypothetical protein